MGEKNPDTVSLRSYVDTRMEDRATAIRAEIEAARSAIATGVDGVRRDIDKAENSLTHRLNDLQRHLDEVRIGAATHMTKESFDSFRAQLDDIMSDYSTRSEVRAQQDTNNVTMAALNQKVTDFITQQTIRSSSLITSEAFEAYKREQANNQQSARRAALSAWIAIGIALVGWALTFFLSLLSHH